MIQCDSIQRIKINQVYKYYFFIEGSYTVEGGNVTCSAYSEPCGDSQGANYITLKYDVEPCPTTTTQPASTTTTTSPTCTCSPEETVIECSATCGTGKRYVAQSCSPACPKRLIHRHEDCLNLPVS